MVQNLFVSLEHCEMDDNLADLLEDIHRAQTQRSNPKTFLCTMFSNGLMCGSICNPKGWTIIVYNTVYRTVEKILRHS